jgi:hypothetical protein
MANSNTYVEGYGNQGTQLTTYDNIQGAGLKLPVPTQDFINIRAPGKIERIFTTTGNSTVLYNQNKPQDLYLKGPVASSMFVYKSIEEGQRNKLTTVFQASRQDGTRVRKFLGSAAGTRFILKQLVLQGFQPFDETKVYNPASPVIAALRLASFGLIDRPTRHLDTSNIVGGLLGGSGLGSIARTVGGLFGGGGPAVPSPPRSSVASGASGGLGLSTFTSLLGGADNSDRVVAPLARPDVRDLLRGQTATNAYNSPRYSKLVSSGGGGFFSKLLGAAGSFLQNNTIIGGIIPPKQPWKANYRADEQTYDLYLNAGKLFDDSNATPTKSGGILSGLKNVLGIGTNRKFTGLRANQRFYHGSVNPSSMLRNDKYIKTYGDQTQQSSVGIVTFQGKTSYNEVQAVASSDFQKPGKNNFGNPITVNGKSTGQLKYTDLINADRNTGTFIEQSDQLLNYKVLIENSKNLPDTFSDETKTPTKLILDNLNKAIENIAGTPANKLYDASTYDSKKNAKPLQFAKYGEEGIGMDYLKDVKTKYTDKFSTDPNQLNFPTRLGRKVGKDRFIQPTHNVDYVNSLDVLNQDQFDKQYGKDSDYKGFGPDIVKFYFYDIVNQKYIPFSATVKGIQDTNNAEWETIDYLGRPDKLYYYKGFTREVSFAFTVNAHSIKELMPMWTRINYLVSLTKPANYTEMASGGFMIPPMVQLTLGDFYKNHFVVIKSCNINIPDDASWETIPENMSSPNDIWSWGTNRAYTWGSTDNLLSTRGDKSDSKGRFAQVPRTADINIQMAILEKDRPKAGRAAWGNAPVPIVDQKLLDQLVKDGALQSADKTLIGNDFYGVVNKNTVTVYRDYNFSTNIRYDTDLEAYAAAANKQVSPTP